MPGNWRETSLAKYGFKSMKDSASIPGQITSMPYTSGPEAPVPSNSFHKTSLCREESGDGRSLTRIPVSRVNCCNSRWRASLNVLLDHSSKRVSVTGSRTDGLVQLSRSKASNTTQIGRATLPGFDHPTYGPRIPCATILRKFINISRGSLSREDRGRYDRPTTGLPAT